MLRIASLCLAFCAAAAAFADERPNILFVYTDDQAAWTIGSAGNPQSITPNLDRMAREGAWLKNAFTTTPVCSPSRVSLLTGRYGTESQIFDWIPPQSSQGLDPRMTTFAEVLASAGYRTGLVGKWHLGHRAPQFHPLQNGYGDFTGFLEGSTTTKNPRLEKDGKLQSFDGLTADVLADQAIAFIKQHKNEPFCLSLHHRAPHTAYLPVADEDMRPYKDRDMQVPDYPGLQVDHAKKQTRDYLASVRSVDRNFGRLLDVLDAEGLADKTVVIFSSDHGYNIGHHGVWHKGNAAWIVKNPPAGTKNIPQGQRPNMFDTSLRVPAYVRWPGKIQPGAVIEETTSNLDWYPTLVALAGGELPAGETIRGRNLLPLLRGEKVADWDDTLYAQYSTENRTRTHMRVVRTPQWKLMRDFLNPGRDELYDLVRDPDETTNLIADPRPEVQRTVSDLHAKLLAHMRGIDDPALKHAAP